MAAPTTNRPTQLLILASEPTKQQLTDYANAVAKVNNYAYAITQTSLPVLNRPPKNYADFSEKFGPAKAHALNWSSSIFPNMLALPQTIINENDLFNLEASQVEGYLTLLKNDPTNEQYRKNLESALTAMQTQVQAELSTIESIENNLITFTADITDDATQLSTIAENALKDAGADESTIKDLNDKIDELNNEINDLQTWLAVSEIGIGLSIFIGLVGAVVAFVPGAQGAGIALIGFAVLGTAGSIAGTVIINKEIKADQKLISDKRNEIDDLNQDIVALNGVNKQFEYLVKANEAAQQALAVIKQMWENLDQGLKHVRADLTSVDTDVTSEKYDAALNDLKEAESEWKEIVDFAKALNGLEYKWQDKDGNWHSVKSNPPQEDGAKVTPIESQAA